MPASFTMTMAKRTSRTRRVTQKQSYLEPEYDTDYESLSENITKPCRHSARLQAAYDELSSTDAPSVPDDALPLHIRPTKRARVTKRKTRSATVSTDDGLFQHAKRVKLRSPKQNLTRKVGMVKKTTGQKIGAGGIIPPWQSLPYQVLVKIMKFAAYPLYKGSSDDTGSTKWLLKLSLLCRPFHEACVAAVLSSPPLLPGRRAHALIRLLKISEEQFGNKDDSSARPRRGMSLSIDYRTKIQHLSFETKALLVSKNGISLDEILKHTPALKSLVFYHHHDYFARRYVWAQPTQSRAEKRWRYTQLYPVLDALPSCLNLRHFEWNARFLTKDDELLSSFRKVNLNTAHFKGLESITLRNFVLDDVENLNEIVIGSNLVGDIGDQPTLQQFRLMTWRSRILEVLLSLKDLKRLSICSSNIFDTSTVANLPKELTRLEIINCPFVNTDGISCFLSNSGNHLQELILRENQSLSLDFITNLKTSSPKLAILEIDLTYSDPTSFQDTEPLFDDLLPNGAPTWPEALQRITIGPLRNLSTEDAEGFFQSLVDTATSLKHLRVLEIRTFLAKTGWRDRATLRRKWNTELNEVFNVNYNPSVQPPTSGRKSQRIHELVPTESQFQISISPHDPPSPAYSALVDAFNGVTHSSPGTDGDDEELLHPTRQGRCHTVLFELSDQRPAQDQFKEEDFLDDE